MIHRAEIFNIEKLYQSGFVFQILKNLIVIVLDNLYFLHHGNFVFENAQKCGLKMALLMNNAQ